MVPSHEIIFSNFFLTSFGFDKHTLVAKQIVILNANLNFLFKYIFHVILISQKYFKEKI